MTSGFVAHDVPMCRQRASEREWMDEGGGELGDLAEWSDRACGMAALRMILLAHSLDAPPLTALLRSGVAAGALSDRGWVQAGVAEFACSLGLPF